MDLLQAVPAVGAKAGLLLLLAVRADVELLVGIAVLFLACYAEVELFLVVDAKGVFLVQAAGEGTVFLLAAADDPVQMDQSIHGGLSYRHLEPGKGSPPQIFWDLILPTLPRPRHLAVGTRVSSVAYV